MAGSYVIIGDGVAGSSAAETIREQDAECAVTVITDEGEPLYNRILTKEFAKGKIPEAPLAIHDEDWYEERDIDLRLNTLVTSVDADEHVVHTHDGETLSYDALLVATGGTPTQLPVPNSDADGIHHFWTFQDARAIAEHAAEAERGVVIGAGLLGIDFAAVCAAQDLPADYIMRGNRWWRYALSLEGAEIVHEGMRNQGVEPVLESGVESFEVDDDGHVTAAIDADGERHPADFVGIAIGLTFNTEFLHGTDVETDNGVVVDEYMRTNDPDIYAAGDITRFYDVIIDDYNQNGSWGSAKEQGSVAGLNMVTDDETEVFRWVPSYSITHYEFPFLSFGHPTIGDEACERRYDETTWRRLTFKDGQLVGGVLIGDLAPQSAYKTLIREERHVVDQQEALLAETVDLDALAPEAGQ
ncbi:MAG: NAD(P)/FAD-dependent oxidoreductase [Halobacteriales archaeon]